VNRAFKSGGRTRQVELTRLGEDRFAAAVDGERLELRATPLGEGFLRLETPEGATVACVTRDGRRSFVTLGGADFLLEAAATAVRRPDAHEAASGSIAMPMPGLVVRVLVAEGDRVARGQPLVLVEAMKMEHTLRAPRDGTVRGLAARPGERVDGGVLLLEVGE
jgi:3-methylcrotonyl-CoA carboxylase alpha subunit